MVKFAKAEGIIYVSLISLLHVGSLPGVDYQFPDLGLFHHH